MPKPAWLLALRRLWVKLSKKKLRPTFYGVSHGGAVPLYIYCCFSEQSKKNDNLTQKPPQPAYSLGLRMGHASKKHDPTMTQP